MYVRGRGTKDTGTSEYGQMWVKGTQMWLSPRLYTLTTTRGADSSAQLQPHTKNKLMKPRQWQQAYLGPPAGWTSACTQIGWCSKEPTVTPRDSNPKQPQQGRLQHRRTKTEQLGGGGGGENPCCGFAIQTPKVPRSRAEMTGVGTTTRSWLCTLLPFSTFKDFF